MPDHGTSHTKQSSPRKLLVLDDDPVFCTFLDAVLTEAGYHVDAYTNSDVALAELRAGAVHPDMILIDLVMPVLTGRDVIAALRSDTSLRGIPVVLISALPVPNIGVALGTTAVLRKPFELDELLRIVAQRLDKQ